MPAPQTDEALRQQWLHRISRFNEAIILTLIGFSFLLAWSAHARAQEAPTTLALFKPGDLGTGGLLLHSKEPGNYVEAPALATDVEIDVTGPVARTRVTQRFENPSEGWVEGIYVFPLPADSAVDTLRLQIGDRMIEGLIKERLEARRIYEEAKAGGFKASLVEQERPNIFTNSVANIGPGETVIVQIEYQESVRLDTNTFSLRFPMVVAPRYSPPPKVLSIDFSPNGGMWGQVSDPVPDRDRISPPVQHPDLGDLNPVTLTVNLNPGFPVDQIESAHHEISVRRNGDKAATLTLKEGEVAANQDFELTWRAKASQNPNAVMFKENHEGDDYVLVMVVPPKLDAETTSRDRETIFVIDNSGSMGGESIRQAKQSLLMALEGLTANDKFNVIRFDDSMDQVFSAPVLASEQNIATAKRFVGRLEAEGGTEMLPALKAALIDHTPQDRNRVRQVIFLTDGAIGNEQELFNQITKKLGRSRLFTVGIGSAPNTYFMSRAARLGRGTFTHIGSEAQVAERMGELFQKLEAPVMTDLVANWPTGSASEVWPAPLPDLYVGEPITLTAKLNDAKGKLRLGGNFNGQPWIFELPLNRAVEGSGVAKLWARNKIASIEETRFYGASPEKIDQGVLDVAITHHLVSRRTSLVAVDVTPSRPDGENLATRDVPLNLPKGWDFDKVFGKPIPTRRASAMPPAPPLMMASLAVSNTQPAQAMADLQQKQIMLPQGSTDARQILIIGILTILLGTLMLLYWSRHSRREA